MSNNNESKNNSENLNSNALGPKDKKNNYSKSRKFIKDALNKFKQPNQPSWKTVLTTLPFILAFADFFLKNSGTPQRSDLFFEKTLPAFTASKPKINSETVDYIYYFNSSLDIKQKLLNLFPKKFNYQQFLFGRPEFVSKIQINPPKQFSKNTVNGLSCNFYSSKLVSSYGSHDFFQTKFSDKFLLTETFYKNLDELPAYLNTRNEAEILPKEDETVSNTDKIVANTNETVPNTDKIVANQNEILSFDHEKLVRGIKDNSIIKKNYRLYQKPFSLTPKTFPTELILVNQGDPLSLPNENFVLLPFTGDLDTKDEIKTLRSLLDQHDGSFDLNNPGTLQIDLLTNEVSKIEVSRENRLTPVKKIFTLPKQEEKTLPTEKTPAETKTSLKTKTQAETNTLPENKILTQSDLDGFLVPLDGEGNFLKNQFYLNRLDFSKDLIQLNATLENLFIKNGLFYNFNFSVADNSLTAKFEKKLRQELAQKKQAREEEKLKQELDEKKQASEEEKELSELEIKQLVEELIQDHYFLKYPNFKIFSEHCSDYGLDKILKKFNSTKSSDEIQGFRTMSGYNYPDMNGFDLYWCYVRKNPATKKNLPVSLIGNKVCEEGKDTKKTFYIQKSILNYFNLMRSDFGFEKTHYQLPSTALPNFVVKTKPIKIRDSNPSLEQMVRLEKFYKGPSVFLDSSNLFDWEISKPRTKTTDWKAFEIEEKAKPSSLNSWFRFYLSPSNSLMQVHQTFWGNFNRSKSDSSSLSDQVSQEKGSFFDQEVINEFKKTTSWSHNEVSLNFFPFDRCYHPYAFPNRPPVFLRGFYLPSTITQNIKESFLPPFLREFFVSSTSNLEESFLPAIQVMQPRDLNGKLYSPLIDKGLIGKLDYQLFSKEEYYSPKFQPIQEFLFNKKIQTLFNNTKQDNHVSVDPWENWQPFSLHSWTILSQLTFAYFFCQVLKDLSATYGAEFFQYLLDLLASVGYLEPALRQQLEIYLGMREKGFRIFLKNRKNFTNIAGAEKLLPELSELILYFRNSARENSSTKTLPRGILLYGPPGTGKTLLVQAIAGESEVPVLTLSGSSLLKPGESGSYKLELLFKTAKTMAPCIIFIDEIDSIAQKRKGIVFHPMSKDEIVESLSYVDNTPTKIPIDFPRREEEEPKLPHQVTMRPPAETSLVEVCFLPKLLIELDGIQGRTGVVVFGATNRPEALDPALQRPGRFDAMFEVGVPGYTKRIEILKFYGDTLGYQSQIAWDYLGKRTEGFTAGDLAALMNESSLKAICNQTAHTIQTIEHGIDRVTTSQSEKSLISKRTGKDNSLTFSSKTSLLRLAYYQAGKVLVSHLLETHPNVVVAYLWPRRTSARLSKIANNLQTSIFNFARLVELNERIIGSYGGKAAEYLFLESFAKRRSIKKQKGQEEPGSGEMNKNQIIFRRPRLQLSNISTLGHEDLRFAQRLIYYVLEKWSFYSKNYKNQKPIILKSNINEHEFNKDQEKLDFMDELFHLLEIPRKIMKTEEEIEEEKLQAKRKKKHMPIRMNEQLNESVGWWQDEGSNEFFATVKNFHNWTRYYLFNPEQNERNVEWLPPDEFYHRFSSLKNVKVAFRNLVKHKVFPSAKTPNQMVPSALESTKEQKNQQLNQSSSSKTQEPVQKKQRFKPRRNVFFTWNEIAEITRDYPAHSLALQSFNKSLSLLNQNRELLDRIVIELLYNGILREPELEKLFKEFQNVEKVESPISSEKEDIQSKPVFRQPETFHIVESSWGMNSRKKITRWIDFGQFK